jgi:hypothetical protein
LIIVIHHIKYRQAFSTAVIGWAAAVHGRAQPTPLERFRAKWIPVRVKKAHQNKDWSLGSDSIRAKA